MTVDQLQVDAGAADLLDGTLEPPDGLGVGRWHPVNAPVVALNL